MRTIVTLFEGIAIDRSRLHLQLYETDKYSIAIRKNNVKKLRKTLDRGVKCIHTPVLQPDTSQM